MALGYLLIGTLVGLLVAATLFASGASLLMALVALSFTGTVGVIGAAIVGANCPSVVRRAI